MQARTKSSRRWERKQWRSSFLAAKGQGNEQFASEIAELFYHLLVLLAVCGLTLANVKAELIRRRR
jgi:phosphoribosyl-ATP pyrophosphohydrolase